MIFTTNAIYIANRLTAADSVAYTWDAGGNLLSDGENTYNYDTANRLTSVTQGSDTYALAYSGLGDRLQQTVDGNPMTYTLDLNAGLTQVLSDGTEAYLYGVSCIAQVNTTTEYFLGDALGSVRQLADAEGTVILGQDYQPYGEVLNSAGEGTTAYGFTGEMTDPTGLVYLRARYYSPYQGRFLTRDTWEGNPNKPMSYNAWLYVYGDPVNLTDPRGLYPCEACAYVSSGWAYRMCMQYCECGYSQQEDWELMGNLTPELRPVYETYLVLKYNAGWWNNDQVGTFTPLDFLEELLWMEASDYGNEIDEIVWQETFVRNFFYRVYTYTGKPASTRSPIDIITYVTRRNMAHGAGREVLLKKGMDPNTVWINRPGLNKIDFSLSLQSHPSAWENMPWVDDTAPMEFGNVDMIRQLNKTNPERYDEAFTAKSPGIEENEFYATTRARIEHFEIIFNYRQLKYWYSIQYP